MTLTAAIKDQISALPHAVGVYYFYDKEDVLIYVGKSNNLQHRVRQHFSGKDRKSLKVQLFTNRIAYELLGSELIAFLYESELIKQHKPRYNRSQRRTIYQYGLYVDNTQPYMRIKVAKIDNTREELTSFSSLNGATSALFEITERHQLCQKINELQKTKGPCFPYQVQACKGACIGKEAPIAYNLRVQEFLHTVVMDKFTRLFIVPGRKEQEKGLVYMEQGVYKGFGFCAADTPESELLQHIVKRRDNQDVRRILMRYFIRQERPEGIV